MWHKIENASDIKSFMERVNDFSDSCVKEMKYISGGFVDRTRSMDAINDRRELYILFQRQYTTYSTFEMKFEKIQKLIMEPYDEQHECVIYGATFVKRNHLYYWFDYAEGDIRDLYQVKASSQEGTCVVAERVFWREVDVPLGNQEFYSCSEK